jgi:hypothetical protein
VDTGGPPDVADRLARNASVAELPDLAAVGEGFVGVHSFVVLMVGPSPLVSGVR